MEVNFQQPVVSKTKRNKVKIVQIIQKNLQNLALFRFETKIFAFKRKYMHDIVSKRNHVLYTFRTILAFLNLFSLQFAYFRLFLPTTGGLNNCFRFDVCIFVSPKVKRNIVGHPTDDTSMVI